MSHNLSRMSRCVHPFLRFRDAEHWPRSHCRLSGHWRGCEAHISHEHSAEEEPETTVPSACHPPPGDVGTLQPGAWVPLQKSGGGRGSLCPVGPGQGAGHRDRAGSRSCSSSGYLSSGSAPSRSVLMGVGGVKALPPARGGCAGQGRPPAARPPPSPPPRASSSPGHRARSPRDHLALVPTASRCTASSEMLRRG